MYPAMTFLIFLLGMFACSSTSTLFFSKSVVNTSACSSMSWLVTRLISIVLIRPIHLAKLYHP